MYILGIDTSNYATSMALFDINSNNVVCDYKEFLPVKKGELGLRQSDAVFHHTVQLPQLYSKITQQFNAKEITAVCVSEKPRPVQGSYMPCFLTGFGFGSAIANTLGVNLYQSTHQQGHIAAAIYATKNQQLFNEKCLVFHASGGTTELLLCNGTDIIECIATSNDLYAGQAVDRLGVKLGFDFPAGVNVSNLAKQCKEDISPKISVKDGNCNLSGLENQCNKLLQQEYENEYICKYCLMFISKTFHEMLKTAYQKYQYPIICAGGVMSSEIIKDYLTKQFDEIYFVPAKYSSDNAIGLSVIGAKLQTKN